ncbi:cyclin D1/2/4, plant [Marchantia polymorpha subsp. ruderalis]|uniref:Uncharacterized protein n=2 Tax=Marchantia polymorpha TaxID=3197 RepID=A0A176VNG7_MARPO|nr:hypothetical protein AXG93_4697s1040 [Marchantia polymorpha subsp. ruderalis]PTQ42311.1 hypothetical protein MARPO_0030s0056 [Marchantia polymorpha]BBN20194.1 hypothetical protein Mp_8g17230 [Marchantia polymorpha subsp. ruderalis]|eukprot:PTQ42311.1 hypothetical protein MARPO_0030s0056 [Marchantia polymorpha]
MAPSIDCPASLYCSEDVSGNGWDEDGNVFCEDLSSDLSEVLHPALHSTIQFPVRNEQAIAALVEKEARHMPEPDYLDRFICKNLDLNVRQTLVNWLLKVQVYHNFGALSISLAVNYLDRFLSRHELPDESEWKVQLLAVACMSLAAKMEETEVPFLLDLQVGDVTHYFEARTVQRMELLVLSTLEWRMSAITPFSYIDYYFAKLGIDNTIVRSLLLRVIDLLLGTLRDVNFLAFRPSVIAAAAVLSALDEHVPIQGEAYKKILCETCNSAELERCLFIMQDVLVEVSPQRFFKRRTFNTSSVPQSPVGVLEAASYSCASDGAQSCEASPSSVSSNTASAPKRRRLDGLCSSLFTFEAL